MTALARFSAAAKGRSNIQQHAILPDTTSPGISVTKLFKYQSFFDGFQLQNAILTQSANEPIVGSTMEEVKIGGYGLALHPSSQTPVAILPMVGGSAAQAAPIILRPGQVYRPHGRIGVAQGNFSTFRWGIPFGWLGGGLATIYILPSSDASVDWSGDAPEIIFQRQQMLVADPTTFGAAGPSDAPLNWPLRFPWPNAARGLTPIPQPGQAIVAVRGAPLLFFLIVGSPSRAPTTWTWTRPATWCSPRRGSSKWFGARSPRMVARVTWAPTTR